MRFSSPGVPPSSEVSTSVKAVDAHVLHAEIVVLLAKDVIEPVPPAGMRSGFYSPYFIVPKKSGGLRPILDLRTFESEASQATVQIAHAETHFRVHPSPRLVCSDRPEGRVLSCLDSSSTQAVSALCVRGSSISVQGPALRAGPVSPRLHESRGGSPCYHERTGRSHPQLSRRLAHSCSVSGAVMRTQGFGAQSPQSAPRACVPACCGLHGGLCQRLGCHVQRACSVRGVDGPPSSSSSWALLSLRYMWGHTVERNVVPHRSTVLHKYRHTTMK